MLVRKRLLFSITIAAATNTNPNASTSCFRKWIWAVGVEPPPTRLPPSHRGSSSVSNILLHAKSYSNKCVKEHDTHKVIYSKKNPVVQTSTTAFYSLHSFSCFPNETPSANSERDRFICLEGRRRDVVRENEMQSRNLEVASDLHLLFSDLIFEKYE